MPRSFSSSVCYSSPSLGVLIEGLTSCFANSLSQSTLSTYNSGFRAYLRFCAFQRLSHFPISELMLCLFVVALSKRNLSCLTIIVYLSGIRFHSLMFGHPVDVKSMHCLFYTLRGRRRVAHKATMHSVHLENLLQLRTYG